MTKAKKPKKLSSQIAERAEKKSGPPYSTRGLDKDGRLADWTRHEPCGGKGCAQCDNLGFTKQFVAV